MTRPTKEQNAAWHADPANWRWGVFYFNPEDPRLLPPKRIRWMGWTINFANPRSVLFFVFLIPALLGLVWAIDRILP